MFENAEGLKNGETNAGKPWCKEIREGRDAAGKSDPDGEDKRKKKRCFHKKKRQPENSDHEIHNLEGHASQGGQEESSRDWQGGWGAKKRGGESSWGMRRGKKESVFGGGDSGKFFTRGRDCKG